MKKCSFSAWIFPLFPLSALLVLCSLSASSCRRRNANSAATDGGATVSVVDYANRKALVPSPVRRIVVLSDNSLPYLKQIGAIDKVVALDSKTKRNLPVSVLSQTDPWLADLPDVGEAKSVDSERIMSLNPDFVIFKGSGKEADSLAEKLGVPVVCFVSSPGLDFGAYGFFGKITGKSERAEEVVAVLRESERKLAAKLSALSLSERKSAYVVVQNSKKSLTRSMRGIMSLDLACVNNLADGFSGADAWGNVDVSKEAIVGLNPDVVFLDMPAGEASIQVEDIKRDENFQFMEAVRGGNIRLADSFRRPKDIACVMAGAYYYASVVYPELVSEDFCASSVNEIFGAAYGVGDYYAAWKKLLRN